MIDRKTLDDAGQNWIERMERQRVADAIAREAMRRREQDLRVGLWGGSLILVASVVGLMYLVAKACL